MKKISKKQLKLDKDIIVSLSANNLDQIKGGGTETFNSNCICVTQYEKTCPLYTQGSNCKVVSDSHADLCCAIKDSKNSCFILATDQENCYQVQETYYCPPAVVLSRDKC